ncbi:hypothetical protein ACIRVF_42805 [Kitasatospora sp. NPDC101157]|uniref:hypothetical protein n=1 Tax=Kitasatospora sp. NPDC101157 TaxID=3364098 RepID=UPI003807EB07
MSSTRSKSWSSAPRLGIPVPGGTDPEVDDYTARTDAASDSGDRISVACRLHEGMSAIFGRVW